MVVLFLLQFLAISWVLQSAARTQEPVLDPRPEHLSSEQGGAVEGELQEGLLQRAVQVEKMLLQKTAEMERKMEASRAEMEGRLLKKTLEMEARLEVVRSGGEDRLAEMEVGGEMSNCTLHAARCTLHAFIQVQLEVLASQLIGHNLVSSGGEGEKEEVTRLLAQEVVRLGQELEVVRREVVEDRRPGQEDVVAGILDKVQDMVRGEVKEHLSEQQSQAVSQDLVTRQELEDEMARLEAALDKRVIEEVEDGGGEEVSPGVESLVDWAGEEWGGSVVAHSPSHPAASLASLTVLGVPVWWSSNLPR